MDFTQLIGASCKSFSTLVTSIDLQRERQREKYRETETERQRETEGERERWSFQVGDNAMSKALTLH